MGCTTADLRERSVINVCNGQNLGRVIELELDVSCGKIVSLIVCGDGLSSLIPGRGQNIISWDRIVKIGKDAILVEVPPELTSKDACADGCRRDKRWWHF